MSKYSIEIEFRYKKSGPINNLTEPHETKETADIAFTYWAQLAQMPASLIHSVTLIEHKVDVTLNRVVKDPRDTIPEDTSIRERVHVVR